MANLISQTAYVEACRTALTAEYPDASPADIEHVLRASDPWTAWRDLVVAAAKSGQVLTAEILDSAYAADDERYLFFKYLLKHYPAAFPTDYLNPDVRNQAPIFIAALAVRFPKLTKRQIEVLYELGAFLIDERSVEEHCSSMLVIDGLLPAGSQRIVYALMDKGFFDRYQRRTGTAHITPLFVEAWRSNYYRKIYHATTTRPQAAPTEEAHDA